MTQPGDQEFFRANNTAKSDEQNPLRGPVTAEPNAPTSGDYTYLDNGQVRLDMNDRSSVLFDHWGEGSKVIKQTTSEGVEFTDFEFPEEGRHPRHMVNPDGTWADLEYPFDGTMHIKGSDGSETWLESDLPDAQILKQTTADGDVFTGFDMDGRPHHVEFAGG